MNLTEQQARETISRMRATQREKDALMKQWLGRYQGARASVLWLYRKQQSASEVAVLESGEHTDPNLNKSLNEDDSRLTDR